MTKTAQRKDPKSTPTSSLTQEVQQDTSNIQEIKTLIEIKFSMLEELISSVETQIKNQNDEFMRSISKAEESSQLALEMGQRKSNQISESKKLTGGNKFEVDQLKDQVKKLNEDMKKLTEELEDTRNRGIRKILIFKNIPQNKKESWEKTKSILAKELNKFMPQYQLKYITSEKRNLGKSLRLLPNSMTRASRK